METTTDDAWILPGTGWFAYPGRWSGAGGIDELLASPPTGRFPNWPGARVIRFSLYHMPPCVACAPLEQRKCDFRASLRRW
jgi:hypothetical protein